MAEMLAANPEVVNYLRRALLDPAGPRGHLLERLTELSEVPRAFRTVHPLGWTIWKGEVIAPTEEELLTGIQG